MPEPIPSCQGDDARFDDEDQALYVARCHAAEFGTDWRAVRCGGSVRHWHVVEGADPDRACPHEDFAVEAAVGRITDGEGGPVMAFVCELRVECVRCREPFRFIGVPAGVMPGRPACSVDEKTLNIPIRPASSDPDFGLGMPGFAVTYHERSALDGE